MDTLLRKFGGPLLPRLISIDIKLSFPAHMKSFNRKDKRYRMRWKRTLKLVARPSVTEVKIDQAGASSTLVKELFAILTPKCTAIRTKHLTLTSPAYSPTYSDFPSLLVVQLGGWIDQPACVQLAACPMLHTIRLYHDFALEANFEHEEDYDPNLSVFFPSLRHLTLGKDLSEVMFYVILSSSTMPVLRELRANLCSMDRETLANLWEYTVRQRSPLLRSFRDEYVEAVQTGWCEVQSLSNDAPSWRKSETV